MELRLTQNHLIDEAELVEKRLNKLVEGHADLTKMIHFVNSEKNTIIHFDRYLTEVNEHDKQAQYAWIDSGYCYKKKPIFISLLNHDGEYSGFFVGVADYLVNGLIERNGSRAKYRQNLERFESKYNKKIEQREVKHLECLQVETCEEVVEEKPAAVKQDVQTEMTDVTEEIFNNLLYPSWKSIKGLDRYIKIIGRRVEQLILTGKTEYFVMNKIRSVVVNTGLINYFGTDYLVLYRLNQKYGTYVAYQIMYGKGDYLDNDFTKEQSSAELKPVQFAEAGEMFFAATIDDFDIDQKSLIHIIEERRDRFTEALQQESAHKISAKLVESLKQGLKIQMRDHSYAKLTYSGRDGQLSWLLPLHINHEFTQEPELVMVIRKESDFYKVKTILSYDDDLKDRITALSLYSHLW